MEADCAERQPAVPERRPLQGTKNDSLLQRRYLSLPFLLACVILSCNTATGINSVIGFNTNILLQSGLVRPGRALGLRRLHLHPNFAPDHRGHDAGGSQGPQVPLHHRNFGDHHRPPLRRSIVRPYRKESPYDAAPALQAMAVKMTPRSPSATTKPSPRSSWSRRRTLSAERSSHWRVIYSYGGFTAHPTSPVRTGKEATATI